MKMKDNGEPVRGRTGVGCVATYHALRAFRLTVGKDPGQKTDGLMTAKQEVHHLAFSQTTVFQKVGGKDLPCQDFGVCGF